MEKAPFFEMDVDISSTLLIFLEAEDVITLERKMTTLQIFVEICIKVLFCCLFFLD